MLCDNCGGGGIDNTYTYCTRCLDLTRERARTAEREKLAKKFDAMQDDEWDSGLFPADVARLIRES